MELQESWVLGCWLLAAGWSLVDPAQNGPATLVL